MHISNLNTEFFSCKIGTIGGDECTLITPINIKCKWDRDTLKFRSLIMRNSDGKIISRGFNKFFNWHEHAELDEFPTGGFEIIEKMDGSLIIWGVHNNTMIHRTRGTFDLSSLPNGDELNFLKSKYPAFIEYVKKTPNYSILTEWETNRNVIVINRVTEPTLTLIGMIHNETGYLKTQAELDTIAEEIGISRPTRYKYDTISDCFDDVKVWKGIEGIVAYSEDGQHLRKWKSDWYLTLHKLRSGFNSIKNIMDVFIESPRFVNVNDFYNHMVQITDYEIAEKIKDDITTVVRAYCNYLYKLNRLTDVVNDLSFCESRKEQAMVITSRYDDWRRAFAFKMLDNQEIDVKLEAKALHYELEEQLKNETTTSNL